MILSTSESDDEDLNLLFSKKPDLHLLISQRTKLQNFIKSVNDSSSPTINTNTKKNLTEFDQLYSSVKQVDFANQLIIDCDRLKEYNCNISKKIINLPKNNNNNNRENSDENSPPSKYRDYFQKLKNEQKNFYNQETEDENDLLKINNIPKKLRTKSAERTTKFTLVNGKIIDQNNKRNKRNIINKKSDSKTYLSLEKLKRKYKTKTTGTLKNIDTFLDNNKNPLCNIDKTVASLNQLTLKKSGNVKENKNVKNKLTLTKKKKLTEVKEKEKETIVCELQKQEEEKEKGKKIIVTKSEVTNTLTIPSDVNIILSDDSPIGKNNTDFDKLSLTSHNNNKKNNKKTTLIQRENNLIGPTEFYDTFVRGLSDSNSNSANNNSSSSSSDTESRYPKRKLYTIYKNKNLIEEEREEQIEKRKKFNNNNNSISDNNNINMSVYDYHRPQTMEGQNYLSATNTQQTTSGTSVGGTHSVLLKNHQNTIIDDDTIIPHHHNNQYLHGPSSSMATLCNIGNTCYLNSVVYTLRFAPLFLHNLHHLIDDLLQVNQKVQNRIKSSSLGRNVTGIQGQSGRSWSSKDLASLGNNVGADVPKSNRQIATEKLHELYQNLHRNELNDTTEPFHADIFLHAVQDVSSIFEGNQQQDAHEFLMCILDSIRETCQSLTKIISDCPDIIVNGYVSVPEQTEIIPQPAPPLKTSFFSRKSKKKEDKIKNAKSESPFKDNHHNIPDTVDGTINNANNFIINPLSGDGGDTFSGDAEKLKITEKIKKLGLDFFSEDFEGVTVSTTKCLSCETITEQKETMIDIAVPIYGYENMETMEKPHLFFQNSCITKEYFRGDNKYRCEQCFGYTEAIRSISFEILPRLLVLQLKRFSGGMEKINSYIPSPLIINCFCIKCCILPDNEKLHIYKLYSIITHVGATMSVGHYIAYTRSLDIYTEYINCPKDKNKRQTNLLNNLNNINTTTNLINTTTSTTTGTTNNGITSNILTENKIINSGLMKKMIFGRSKASSSGDVTKNLKNLNGVMNKLLPNGSGDKNNTTTGTGTTTTIQSSTTTTNFTTCQGINCCGIHVKNNHTMLMLNNNGNGNSLNGNMMSLEIGDNHHNNIQSSSSLINTNYNIEQQNMNNHHHNNHQNNYQLNNRQQQQQEPLWYMCDDDKIKEMTQREFEELLSPNNKVTITPYLLFYARTDVP